MKTLATLLLALFASAGIARAQSLGGTVSFGADGTVSYPSGFWTANSGAISNALNLSLFVPITRQVLAGGSLTGGGALSADVTLSLANDATSPGVLRYYGTDGSGAKGWFALPVASGGDGDMLVAIYDTDGDGIVDAAESVAWADITSKPSTYTPAAHTHTASEISDSTATGRALLGAASAAAARTALSLGDSATRSVGTGSGTVAAGDDSRFLSSSQKTDLTDGGDATSHYHASDRDRANHTGTQDISITTTGTLPASRGGTGLSSFSVGDLITATGSTTLAPLAAGASGRVLSSQGAGQPLQWIELPAGEGGGIADAPDDGVAYVRQGEGWETNTAARIADATTAGRALLTAADAAAQRAALGVGSAGTNAASAFAPASHTHTASAISDSTTAGRTLLTAANAAAQRAALDLEPGTDVQAYSANLAALASAGSTGTGAFVRESALSGSGGGNASTNVAQTWTETQTFQSNAVFNGTVTVNGAMHVEALVPETVIDEAYLDDDLTRDAELASGLATKQNADTDLLQIATISASTGDIIYRHANGWTNLGAGSAGQVLKMSSGVPSWGTDNSGSFSWDLDFTAATSGSTPTPVWSNTVPENTTHFVRADIVGAGPTNGAMFSINAILNNDGLSGVFLQTVYGHSETDSGIDAAFSQDGDALLLTLTGPENENFNWLVKGLLFGQANASSGEIAGCETTDTAIPHDVMLEGFQGGYELTGWTEGGTTANINDEFNTTALSTGRPDGACDTGLQIVLPTDGTETYAQWTNSSVIDLDAQALDLTFHVWVDDPPPTGATYSIIQIRQGSLLSAEVAMRESGGNTQVRAAGTSNTTYTTITTGQWNRFDIHLDPTGASSTFAINGGSPESFTRIATRDFDNLRIGAGTGLDPGESGTLIFDVIAINTP